MGQEVVVMPVWLYTAFWSLALAALGTIGLSVVGLQLLAISVLLDIVDHLRALTLALRELRPPVVVSEDVRRELAEHPLEQFASELRYEADSDTHRETLWRKAARRARQAIGFARRRDPE